MTNITKLPTAMDRADVLKAKALNFIEQAQGARRSRRGLDHR